MKVTLKDLLEAVNGDDSVEVKLIGWEEHQVTVNQPAGYYRAMVSPHKYILIVSTRPEDEGITKTEWEAMKVSEDKS